MGKGIQVFGYEAPAASTGKTHIKLTKTEYLKADVQKIGPGGETNLHSHSGNDGFWFVLSGRARFYGSETEVVTEVGPNEGVLVPHSTPYWFESAGEEPLEILHVAARTAAAHDKRVDYTERPARKRTSPDAQTASAPSG